MISFKQNIFTERIFLTELNFLKGDTNIYFEYITLFEKKKKIFTEKNKVFVKIIHTFFLKIQFFFRIVLLHLNNHNRYGDKSITGEVFLNPSIKVVSQALAWSRQSFHQLCPKNDFFQEKAKTSAGHEVVLLNGTVLTSLI